MSMNRQKTWQGLVTQSGAVLDRASPTYRLAQIEMAVMEPYGKLSEAWLRFLKRPLAEDWRLAALSWVGNLRINRGFTVATVLNYVRGLGEFFDYLVESNIDINAVTATLVSGWLQTCYIEKRQASATRLLKLNAVKSFYHWRDQEGIAPSPLTGLQGPKKIKRVARKYSDKQLAALFASCDVTTVKGRRDLAVLLFFYQTGARRMEVEGLRTHDLDLRERSGSARLHGKGAKERLVTFEGPVIDALRAWMTDRDAIAAAGELVDKDAVFIALAPKDMGRILTKHGLWYVINHAVERSKIRDASGDMGLHRLRSTFATHLYDAGHDIRAIQNVLGHEQIETTLAYIAISKRQIKVRLPAAGVFKLMGVAKNEKPLWLQRKEKQRGLFQTENEI